MKVAQFLTEPIVATLAKGQGWVPINPHKSVNLAPFHVLVGANHMYVGYFIE
jgi:hypothetical protein